MAANISAVIDDDTFGDDLGNVAIVTSVIYGFGIFMSFVVIKGAISNNAILVGLGVLWTAVQTIAGIVLQIRSYTDSGLKYPFVDAIIRIGVSSMLIYPLAVFISEVRRGIMSTETY